MSVDRQQMLETAERLNQQMADGIPYTWETLEQALAFVTEKRDRGIHGRICYFAAFYHLDTGNQEQCLKYLDESVRCLLGTDQEIHVARAYNMIGIVAHMQNNLSLAMHIILSESMTEPCSVIENASVNLKKQVMTAFTAGSISGKCCQSMAVVCCIWI